MLEVKDLKFSVSGHSILNGVNFAIQPGETVGIIGPNGCGKTTLFNCLSGFNRPSSGRISFKDKDFTHLSPHKRALEGFGRVFQNFGIFREMTVIENVITALESRQTGLSFMPSFINGSKRRSEAMEFLAQVRIEGKANDKASSLSGGQMRLLEIVRTLAFGAELFLLDEPTAGVSPRMKDDIANLISRLQSMKKTVMVIEHDINFIQKFCDRVIVMDSGLVVLDDTPDAVRHNVMLQEIYFGKSSQADQRKEAVAE
jgi:branched-chain amino acid transport system ATP-binding protein